MKEEADAEDELDKVGSELIAEDVNEEDFKGSVRERRGEASLSEDSFDFFKNLFGERDLIRSEEESLSTVSWEPKEGVLKDELRWGAKEVREREFSGLLESVNWGLEAETCSGEIGDTS